MKTICVVEDNTPIRKLFCTLLKKSGFNVIDFPDGQSALNWLNDNDCFGIVTDILLPDISGNELLNLIRKLDRHRALKAIAVTGFSDFDDKQKFIDFGFDHYMTKPVEVSSFVKEVKIIFEQNGDRDLNESK